MIVIVLLTLNLNIIYGLSQLCKLNDFPLYEIKTFIKGGGYPPQQHDLKFCQFVGASSKGLNIKYLLGWMRSRGDIRFTKFEKVVFSSYFEGRCKSNS